MTPMESSLIIILYVIVMILTFAFNRQYTRHGKDYLVADITFSIFFPLFWLILTGMIVVRGYKSMCK